MNKEDLEIFYKVVSGAIFGLSQRTEVTTVVSHVYLEKNIVRLILTIEVNSERYNVQKAWSLEAIRWLKVNPFLDGGFGIEIGYMVDKLIDSLSVKD